MHDSDLPDSGLKQVANRDPLAALVFDTKAQPALVDLVTLSRDRRGFAVTGNGGDHGQAELLCDGLTFACSGLAPAPALPMDETLTLTALPGDFARVGHAMVMLSPGPHLAGTGHLLSVVRVLTGLVRNLAAMPGLCAVAWLPARLVMAPAWFDKAVGPWLQGGPFPALALTALSRSKGGFVSCGLAWFTGQEFVFSGKDGILRESDARGAVRLTDWLVAHGPVKSACEIELAGFGTVLVEPDGQNGLRARSL